MPHVSRTLATTALLAVAAWSTACGGGAPAAVAPLPTAIEWREVGSWSGGLSRQTESFEVSMAAMRLRWKTTRESSPGAGRLIVTLHSAVSGRYLDTIVDARGVTSGTVNVVDEPRWCHFVIEANNADWQMTLEQGFASDAR